MTIRLYTLFLLLLITVNSNGQTLGYDKMRPSQLIMKTGDTINVIGKLKSKVFKYKKYSTAKSLKIEYSKLESVRIRLKKNRFITYKFFPTKDKNKMLPVNELVVGSKISLYGVTNGFISQGVGGTRFQGNSTVYYIKKQHENELTKLGRYNPPFGNLKDKVKAIFKDCDLLLKKIENKEFRIRSDVEKMFKFYNKECK